MLVPFQWKLYSGVLPSAFPLYVLSDPLPRLCAWRGVFCRFFGVNGIVAIAIIFVARCCIYRFTRNRFARLQSRLCYRLIATRNKCHAQHNRHKNCDCSFHHKYHLKQHNTETLSKVQQIIDYLTKTPTLSAQRQVPHLHRGLLRLPDPHPVSARASAHKHQGHNHILHHLTVYSIFISVSSTGS